MTTRQISVSEENSKDYGKDKLAMYR